MSGISFNNDTRDWPSIRQTLYATHVAGIFTFLQLGVTTHRHKSTWWRQDIFYPVFFCFFPLLYVAQVVVAVPLAVRNLIWRRYHGIRYYVCGVLGMYANRTHFPYHDGGNSLLLDVFQPRAEPTNKPWTYSRGLAIGINLLGLYQVVSTSILYIHRWMLKEASLLAVDHRTGAMAIGATFVSLSQLFLDITGWDWEDILCKPGTQAENLQDWPNGTLHRFAQDDKNLIVSLDVTNKYVYDCALAVCLHLIHLRMANAYFPLFERRDPAMFDATYGTVLTSLILGCVLVTLASEAFWISERKLSYKLVPMGDKISRLSIALAMFYIATVTIYTEIVEVNRAVKGGLPTTLNADWAWRDPWVSFLWSF